MQIAAERERTRQEREKKLQTLGLSNTNQEVSTPPAFIDPRSPTFDYVRTPIAFEEGDSTDQQTTEKGRGKFSHNKIYFKNNFIIHTKTNIL